MKNKKEYKEQGMVKISRIILAILIYAATLFFAVLAENIIALSIITLIGGFYVILNIRYFYLKSKIYSLNSNKFKKFTSAGQSIFLKEDSFGKIKYFRCYLNTLNSNYQLGKSMLIKHTENLIDGTYEVKNMEGIVSLKLKIAD